MRSLLVVIMLICLHSAYAQCKTFRISSKGDTLNCTDMNNKKQGPWVIHQDGLRGNPGYDEEGEFEDDKKEGIWRKYTTMGDLLAVESYKWGNLDGLSQYYTVAGLEREESWRASNPNKAYDTIQVPDPSNPNKYEEVVVKNDGRSLKHGTWKWYRTGSMSIYRTEVYVLDKLQTPDDLIKKDDTAGGNATDSTATGTKTAPKEKAKPQAVMDYEKKNSGKKASKVREGRVGL